MRFNVSQSRMEGIKKHIENNWCWSMDRRDSPKARKALAILPVNACIVCTKTKEVVWAQIYEWSLITVDEHGPKLRCYVRRRNDDATV